METLLRTDLSGLPPPRRGKVREVYDLGSRVLIVATDRISAFDVVMENGIPDKGRILNQMSAYWFGRLSSICSNHLLTVDDNSIRSEIGFAWKPELAGRCALALKAEPLPIEFVARGYITGSLFKEYRSGSSSHAHISDLALPVGLTDGDRLPEPIFTPATKATEGHDLNIGFAAVADSIGRDLATQGRDLTLKLYRNAAEHAASKGLILADTKFEFGLVEGRLTWIDEALTPDSSRYWEAKTWRPGGPQPSFDKQFVRDYLEKMGWGKRPPGPKLPDEVVQATRAKYLEAFRRITASELAGV